MQPTMEQNKQQQQLATASMLQQQQVWINSMFASMAQNVLKSPENLPNPLGLAQNGISRTTCGTSTTAIVPDAAIAKDSVSTVHSSPPAPEHREQSGSAKRSRFALDEGFCLLHIHILSN